MGIFQKLKLHARETVDFLDIYTFSQATLAISAVAAQTAALDEGIYDVWCNEAEVFVRIDATATGVTTGNGYPIKIGNVLSFQIRPNHRIGAILASGSGTLRYHRVA